jgi:HSP20 family molecular chaperone IbpA
MERIMYAESIDVFGEIDAIFDRLFNRMFRDFLKEEGEFTPSSSSHENHLIASGGPELQARIGGSGEPVPEIFRGDGVVKIVTSLPGVTGENLNLVLRGGKLIAEAACEDRVVHGETPLPTDIDPSTLTHSLKNGVLEVSFRIRAGA